jgi:hypothetical protein
MIPFPDRGNNHFAFRHLSFLRKEESLRDLLQGAGTIHLLISFNEQAIGVLFSSDKFQVTCSYKYAMIWNIVHPGRPHETLSAHDSRFFVSPSKRVW